MNQATDDIREGSDPAATVTRILDRLCRATSVRFDRAAVRDFLPGAVRQDPDDPLRVVERAGRRTGLRVTIRCCTVAEAARLAHPDAPLLSCRSTESGVTWLLLTEGRGDRALGCDPSGQEPPRWSSLRSFAGRLGVEETGPQISWAVVEAELPFAGAKARGEATLSPLARLRRLARADRADILAVVLFSIVIGGLLLATPVAVQSLVNIVAFGGQLPPLLVLSLLLFVGLAAAAAIIAVQTWIVELLQRRIFVRMVADLAHRLPRVMYEVGDRHYGRELVNRFFDVLTVQKVSSLLLLDGLSTVLGVLVGLVVLAFYHPILLAFDLVLLVAIALVILWPARAGTRTAIAESKAKYAVAGWLEEIAGNPVTFKSPRSEAFAVERADTLARDYLTKRSGHFRVLFGQILAALGLQALASTALLGIGGLLVIAGELSLGQLVAAELIVSVVVGSVAKMGKHVEGFYDLMAAVDKLGSLIDLPLEPSHGSGAPLASPPAAGASVALAGVSIRSGDGRTILRGLDLELGASERLGVSGRSGSGRSTLLHLLYGLRRPSAGVVRIDGRDLREWAPGELREAVAMVGPLEIVEGTVRENIVLGRVGVPDDVLRGTLDRLGLLPAIEALPSGLETPLRASGVPLSESQARRLMIARAVLGRPRLVLVDGMLESFSPVTRQLATDVLFDPEARWTLIVVSDHEPTLEACDRRISLEPVG